MPKKAAETTGIYGREAREERVSEFKAAERF